MPLDFQGPKLLASQMPKDPESSQSRSAQHEVHPNNDSFAVADEGSDQIVRRKLRCWLSCCRMFGTRSQLMGFQFRVEEIL